MSVRSRSTWLALVAVAGIIVSACGSAPVGTGALTATGPASSGLLTVGPVHDPMPKVDVSGDALAHLADAELAMRATGRAQSGMVAELGADGPAVFAAIDAAQTRALTDLQTTWDAQLASASGDGLVASIGAPPMAPASGNQVVTASALALVFAAMNASKALGTTSATTSTATTDDKIANGDTTGDLKLTATMTSTPAGSRLVADVTIKMDGNFKDSKTGASGRITGEAQAHIEIEGCPDTSGLAPGQVRLTANESIYASGDAGSAGFGWNKTIASEFKLRVDDQALIAGLILDASIDTSLKGGTRKAGASQADLHSYEVGISFHAEYDGTFMNMSGNEATATLNVSTAQGATRADYQSAQSDMIRTSMLAIVVVGGAAEKFWRSGKCVEVVVDPQGGNVAPDSKTTVTTKVRQKFEASELDKPVEANLSGVKLIEPAGQKVPAPATFTYTAGAKEGDSGEVTFKSVSNRGIGETPVTFTVGGGWVTQNPPGAPGTYKGEKCHGLDGVWLITEEIKSVGLAETGTYRFTIDGQTLQGTFAFNGSSTLLAGKATSKATGPASIAVQPDGSVIMTTTAGTITNSTTLPSGDAFSIKLPYAALTFTWTPGGNCAPAP